MRSKLAFGTLAAKGTGGGGGGDFRPKCVQKFRARFRTISMRKKEKKLPFVTPKYAPLLRHRSPTPAPVPLGVNERETFVSEGFYVKVCVDWCLCEVYMS